MDSSLYADEKIAKIYNRQYSMVYRICFSFMKNAEDAEDMAQETFLKLITSKKQFESQEHEKAWLIVTASNTCKDELRRWKRRLENIKSLPQQENVNRKEGDRVLEITKEKEAFEKEQRIPCEIRSCVGRDFGREPVCGNDCICLLCLWIKRSSSGEGNGFRFVYTG